MAVQANRIVGIVGYRCCGKSTIRAILTEMGCNVFDTNSIKTGDGDANTISIDDVVKRYGEGRSYLLFLKDALLRFVGSVNQTVFIDSLKALADMAVIKELFPEHRLLIWHLDAPFSVREERYASRDLKHGIRSQTLSTHDRALNKLGIETLIQQADFRTDMNKSMDKIVVEVQRLLKMFE